MAKSKINKESYSYYKTLFRATKRYYDKMNYGTGEMLSEQHWEYYKQHGNSNSEIVYSQFHSYDKETVKGITNAFKEAGLTINSKIRGKIARGEYTDEMFDLIKRAYHEGRNNGKSSTEMQEQLAGLYFGS